jgi:hypothetical protein
MLALHDRHADEFVQATLIERIDREYAARTDGQWLTFAAAEAARASLAGAPMPEHAHWRWERKVARVAHLLPYPTLSVECEGVAQGLMLLKTDGEVARLPAELTRPLVYVVFLASAPWNLPTALRPRFRGVGTSLMRAAVEISLDLGFKGRIGLHALPQSEPFYDQVGMTALGRDVDKENLNYFEMAPAQAAAFIR